MSEEDIKQLEEQMEQFARFFEEGAMTLIAKMSEINDKLDRISSAVEMIDKLRMQAVENKQVMSQVNKGYTNLVRRLNNMSQGGFVVPAAPPPGTETKTMDMGMLNAEISVSAIMDDDLSDLGEAPSMEELQKQFGTKTEEPKAEEPKVEVPKVEVPKAEEPKAEEPKVEVPKVEEPKTEEPKVEEPKTEEPKVEEANDDDKVASATGLPKSGRKRIENPVNAKDILANLIVDIEEANLKAHVGTLILQAKEKLAKMVPFHTSYFEMIMFGGKLKNKKVPNTAELLKETIDKIENTWLPKF